MPFTAVVFAASRGVVVEFVSPLLPVPLIKTQYVDSESNFGGAGCSSDSSAVSHVVDGAKDTDGNATKGECGKNKIRFASVKSNKDTQPRASPHSNILPVFTKLIKVTRLVHISCVDTA